MGYSESYRLWPGPAYRHLVCGFHAWALPLTAPTAPIPFPAAWEHLGLYQQGPGSTQMPDPLCPAHMWGKGALMGPHPAPPCRPLNYRTQTEAVPTLLRAYTALLTYLKKWAEQWRPRMF